MCRCKRRSPVVVRFTEKYSDPILEISLIGIALADNPVLYFLEITRPGVLGTLVKPPDDRHAPNHQEGRQHLNIPCRQRSVLSISFEQCLAESTKVRGERVFNERRCNLVHVPTVRRIIEIDQREIFSVINDVVGMEIGVDQGQ